MHVMVHVNVHTQANIQYKQRVTPRKCTMLCQQPGPVNASLPGQDMRTTQDLGLPSNRSALGRSTQHSDQLDLHTHMSKSVMLVELVQQQQCIQRRMPCMNRNVSCIGAKCIHVQVADFQMYNLALRIHA
jgi:hypothetical protein